VFLEVLCQVNVVPAFTQNVAFPFGFAILATDSAELAVRLTSTVQGVEADPQVILALHNAAGLASKQAYLLAFLDCACATTQLSSKKNNSKSELEQIAKLR
jgi:hypothetical protein